MRWILTFLVACLIFSGIQGWLRKIGLGRLPGDFSFRAGGRDWYVPLASAVVVSTLCMLIGWLI